MPGTVPQTGMHALSRHAHVAGQGAVGGVVGQSYWVKQKFFGRHSEPRHFCDGSAHCAVGPGHCAQHAAPHAPVCRMTVPVHCASQALGYVLPSAPQTGA